MAEFGTKCADARLFTQVQVVTNFTDRAVCPGVIMRVLNATWLHPI